MLLRLSLEDESLYDALTTSGNHIMLIWKPHNLKQDTKLKIISKPLNSMQNLISVNRRHNFLQILIEIQDFLNHQPKERSLYLKFRDLDSKPSYNMYHMRKFPPWNRRYSYESTNLGYV